MPDDANLSLLQATIASFRYWVPSISDVARVADSDADGIWRLIVQPFQAGACPFELMLSRAGTYALTADGVVNDERAIDNLDIFLPLAEAIADGQIAQRHWSSANTGIETRIDTFIALPGGHTWSGTVRRHTATLVPPGAEEVSRPRHFLPYRRR